MDKFELFNRSLKKRGLFNTLGYIWHELAFDLLNKTDTKPEIAAYDPITQNFDDFSAPCQGANPWVVNRCIDELSKSGVEISRASFLDIGSGKGRAMLIAAFWGFERVIGVELDANLCLIAERNIEKNRDKLKCSSHLICNEDAARYTPPEGVNVVFMYNPFGINLMRQVLGMLVNKYINSNDKSSVKPVYIIYVNPVCADVFTEFGLTPIRDVVNEALIYKIE